jgi:RNA polymerase sigma-70 factor (ECF subfamily)
MHPSDPELLRRLGKGDREALAPLMERHYRRLYRIVLSYVRDPEEALDGVQETFVKAYCHAARWDGSTEVGAWLTRIAVNEAIDRYRRGKRRAASFEPLGDGDAHAHAQGDSPERVLGRREVRETIAAALAALPAKQRAVFVLRHHEEMTLEEIARALGLRLGTVKSCLHRAVHRLREQLGGARGDLRGVERP